MAKEAANLQTVSSNNIPIDKDVPMPANARGRKAGAYPIDALDVGDSFHVPAANGDDPVGRLSSIVSSARLKYSPVLKDEAGKPRMETYERTSYKRGANGKGFAKDADGKRIVDKVVAGERAVRGDPTRTFRVVKVGADDPRGPGARCYRES